MLVSVGFSMITFVLSFAAQVLTPMEALGNDPLPHDHNRGLRCRSHETCDITTGSARASSSQGPWPLPWAAA